jgi:hypothetical protein
LDQVVGTTGAGELEGAAQAGMLVTEPIAQVLDQVVPVEQVDGVGKVALPKGFDPTRSIGDQEDLASVEDAAGLELMGQS